MSGVGPADQLISVGVPVVCDLPGVGQNLRDHPIVPVTFRVKPDHVMNEHDPRLQMVASWTAEGSHLRRDLMIVMLSHAVEGWYRGSEEQEPVGFRFVTLLELAIGSGEIRLTSPDPDIQPYIDYNYLQEEFDRRRMREGVRLSAKLGEHPALEALVQERIAPSDVELATDEALDEYMLRIASTGQHISCTCKMGTADDPMAVVDQYGKVYGLKGLRIADASIMPDCIRANTNVTTMMIGERIADFIRQGK